MDADSPANTSNLPELQTTLTANIVELQTFLAQLTTNVQPPAFDYDPTVSVRRYISDPGNPGGQDIFGGHPWPPDHRWETDAELRERIKQTLTGPP